MSHKKKTISIINLHIKALVVTKGKKKEEETRNGTKGIRKRPGIIRYRRVCLSIFIGYLLYPSSSLSLLIIKPISYEAMITQLLLAKVIQIY